MDNYFFDNIMVSTNRRSQRAKTLEDKLNEVSLATNSVSKAFYEIRKELQSENEYLREKSNVLQNQVSSNETKIDLIQNENQEARREMIFLEEKLDSMAKLLRQMEAQRNALLYESNSWEDVLRSAWHTENL